MEEIAVVYARSLFEVAKDQDKLDDVREQLGGVVLRAGDAGVPEPCDGSREHRPSGAHCSSASSRAARSASMQESSTGWRSPLSTWSRL